MKQTNSLRKRLLSALLALVCVLGLLPASAFAASPGTIKMDDCAYSGTKYDSPALGECYLHQMHFGLNGKSTMGFCAEKGKGMGWSLKGHTWGNPKPISDPTVKTMMAYFYAHSTGVFTDRAHALGVDDVWGSDYIWTMNAWTQAIVWRYKAGLLSDPVTACAEELMCVYNNLEHTNYSSIDDLLDGTSFEIKGIHYHYHDDVTTGPDGKAVLTNIPVDSYEVIEKSVPDPYVVGEEPTQTIYLGPGENRELIFDNLKQPVLKISKVEQGTNTPIPGTVFTVEGIDSDYRHDVTTEADGFATLRLAPGSYRVTEKSVPAPYCLPEDEADRTQTISLNGGDEKTLIFKNSKKPLLTLSKIDADTGVPVPGTVLTVEGIDSDYKDDWKTGPDGTVALRVDPGTYRIMEKSVPAPYYLPDKDADRVQTISLNPGDEKTVVFRNHKTPELTIFKEDSVAGAPIEGAKFRVTYTSNGEATGAPAYMDFGIFVTDASGQIKLHEKGKKLYPGEYTVTEVEPAPGYQMKEPTTQKVILHGGESKTLTFFNEPLNAIVVEKYDSVTHEALPGCTFQLKYLGGTSGTGGTVIGTKVTGKNGTAIWTGLKSGTYIVEEIDPADGYSIINSSETVYISDKGEQNVVTVSFDNAPDGI